MRRRYRWDEKSKALVEISSDWTPTPRVYVQTDAQFEGARSAEGEDISTRKRHRAYMKRRGLAMAADFEQSWSAAEQKRASFWEDQAGERKADLSRTLDYLAAGGQPARRRG